MFHFFYVSSLGLKFVSIVSLDNIFFSYSVEMDLNHNILYVLTFSISKNLLSCPFVKCGPM